MQLPDWFRRYGHPTLVFVGACTLWLTRMPLVNAYYERTFDLGYYLPDADSIGIPIASNAVMTVLLFPVVLAVLWAILTNFPARYGWLAWHKRQWFWSAFWTLMCGYLIYQTLDILRENWKIGLPLNALSNLGCIMLWLELRAILVSKLR